METQGRHFQSAESVAETETATVSKIRPLVLSFIMWCLSAPRLSLVRVSDCRVTSLSLYWLYWSSVTPLRRIAESVLAGVYVTDSCLGNSVWFCHIQSVVVVRVISNLLQYKTATAHKLLLSRSFSHSLILTAESAGGPVQSVIDNGQWLKLSAVDKNKNKKPANEYKHSTIVTNACKTNEINNYCHRDSS